MRIVRVGGLDLEHRATRKTNELTYHDLLASRMRRAADKPGRTFNRTAVRFPRRNIAYSQHLSTLSATNFRARPRWKRHQRFRQAIRLLIAQSVPLRPRSGRRLSGTRQATITGGRPGLRSSRNIDSSIVVRELYAEDTSRNFNGNQAVLYIAQHGLRISGQRIPESASPAQSNM
jgi:hypothetical protein